MFTRDFVFTTELILVFGLGFINSFAVYCNFRAVNMSLTKTSILRPLSSIMAIILGYLFLDEIKFLNKFILLGVLFCFSSTVLFIINNKNNNNNEKYISTDNRRFLGWISGVVVIFAFVSFFMRYFALEGITLTEFIASWYFGALSGSALLLLPARKNETFYKLSANNNIAVFLLAFFIWSAFILSYSATGIAPITVTEPILLVGGMIAPALIGLFWFKEIKKFSTSDYIGLISGVTGAIIIFFGY